MKGMVKSTAVCRMEVTDISITAMSAFWDLSSAIMPVHLGGNDKDEGGGMKIMAMTGQMFSEQK